MHTMANMFKTIPTILLTVAAFEIAVAGENANSQGADNPVITSVPRSMTYQGILKNSDGEGIPDSFFDVIFKLFDAENDGTQLWSDIVTVHTDGNGYFTAELDNINIPFDLDYWLELEIDTEILSPRQRLNMSAYAARADTADYALASAAGGSGWIDDGMVVRLETSTDKIGIGTASPSNMVHIYGSDSAPLLNVEKNGPGRGLRVSTSSACALWVENAGNHGLRVTQANGNGVNITNANNDGIHVENAGNWAGYFNGKGYFGDIVGIGTMSPSAQLDVNGTIQMQGLRMQTGASDGYILTSDASGNGTWQPAGGGGGSNWTVTDSVLYTNSYWGIARGGAGNALYRDSAHTMVNLGVACTTGVDNYIFMYETIAGGWQNKARGDFATVGGGQQNFSQGDHSTIGGGMQNTAGGSGSTISGGQLNTTGEGVATIGGGLENSANFEGATVSGGISNTADHYYTTVGGGMYNSAGEWFATVGGGYSNSASGPGATIAGGEFDSASGQYSTVGGGLSNSATGERSVVGGGSNNTAVGVYSSILGGQSNNTSSSAYGATISGGYMNNASFNYATICGGSENYATNDHATVAGGNNNGATGSYSTVSGGVFNFANGDYSGVASGSDNTVDGDWSAILGGFSNNISSSANYSYLFGINGNLTQDSTFMVDLPHIRFGDESTGYEFPTDDGTIGQVLTTDGAGQLGWMTPTITTSDMNEILETINELKIQNAALERRIAELEANSR